jgi:hypothetical protein
VKGVTEDFTGAVSHVEHYYDYVDFRTEIADLTVFEASYYILSLLFLLLFLGIVLLV